MHTLLVTLLGPGQRVDLQLPADIPVGKLLPELLAQCNPQALDGRSTDHAPWTLALADRAHRWISICRYRMLASEMGRRLCCVTSRHNRHNLCHKWITKSMSLLLTWRYPCAR